MITYAIVRDLETVPDLLRYAAHMASRRERAARRVHRAAGFPDDLLALVEHASMDKRHNHLDAELATWAPEPVISVPAETETCVR